MILACFCLILSDFILKKSRYLFMLPWKSSRQPSTIAVIFQILLTATLGLSRQLFWVSFWIFHWIYLGTVYAKKSVIFLKKLFIFLEFFKNCLRRNLASLCGCMLENRTSQWASKRWYLRPFMDDLQTGVYPCVGLNRYLILKMPKCVRCPCDRTGPILNWPI